MELFDTHAYLDQHEFDDDRSEMIARARAAGVTTLVAVGTTAATSEACVELAALHEEVLAAVGIQPNYCTEARPDDWDRVLGLVGRGGVVAIGETGLDRHWDYTPLDVQRDYFDRHLRISQQVGLPFIVHTRESDAEVLAMLREARQRGPLVGVMHSFTGSVETAAECVALGLFISFAGMVTYKKSDVLRTVARQVPADRILIETDSPYLSPHPLRGQRNEPAHLIHTAACLAKERGQTLEEFAALTTRNARRLFGGTVGQVSNLP